MSATPMRKEYTRASLGETDVDPDPIRQFGAWFEEAVSAGASPLSLIP